MQYKQYAVLASVVLAAGVAGQALAQGTPAKSTNIGIVDRNKVITSFTKAQQAAQELKGQEDKVRNLLESSNKKYEEAKAAKKSPTELKALQDSLQKQIDTEYKAAQGRAQALESQLESDIDKAIKDEATSKNLDTVLVKDSVLLGGLDITDGVIKRLPATASAGTKTVTK
ncbi:MAG: OmpH family outer membrane protein [Cyanobacteria bacterium SZAS LIN-2]|nr:OmpH family outer membrane protein [Cyanobacteria bacterium SZAS LIN-3]MBS1996314.1 OmpH family outer membrane protein [Cyanobacteria bacterium SZAS LIN-2]